MAEAVKPKRKPKSKVNAKHKPPLQSETEAVDISVPKENSLSSSKGFASSSHEPVKKDITDLVHRVSCSETHSTLESTPKALSQTPFEDQSYKSEDYEDLLSLSSKDVSEGSKNTSASFSCLTSELQQMESTEGLVQELETLSVDEGPFDVGCQLKSVTSAPELSQLPTEGQAPMEALLENPFRGLQDTVSSEASQETEPSAPTPVPITSLIDECHPGHFEIESRSIMRSNIIQSEPSIEDLIVEVDRQQQYLEQHNFVKPYTVSQLRGLFPHPLLEDYEEYSHTFVSDWSNSQPDHELHQVLRSYLRALTILQTDLAEFQDLEARAELERDTVWTHRTEKVSGASVCADMKSIAVSHEYLVPVLEAGVLSNLGKSLKKAREVLSDKISLDSYCVALHRLQAHNYVHNVLASPEFSEVKVCISILFAFQRQPIRDKEFSAQTRDWLSALVSVLLQFRNVEDHLFLLHHILRCPSGVSRWAAPYIQTPSLSDSGANMDIALALFATLLSPVEGKDSFLLAWDSKTDESFVWLDSDGEDEEGSSALQFSEGDLASILKQIPWADLMRALLNIEQRDGRDLHCPVDWDRFLKVLASAKQMALILEKGMRTYASLRYKQFAKKLCQLLQHLLLFVCDHWEAGLLASSPWDQSMWHRLQTEFDHLFETIALVLLRSKKWGGWQFLASLPYQLLSIKTLWDLYMNCQRAEEWDKFGTNCEEAPKEFQRSVVVWAEHLRDEQFWLKVSEGLAVLPEAEVFWLLMTFANMAIARDIRTECVLPRLILWEIFEIGYVNSSTRELASKGARELLSNVLSKHPTLFTFLLTRVQSVITHLGKSVLYLFKELPMSLWQVGDADLEILRHWALDYDLNSPEQSLVSMVLASLAYLTLPFRVSEQVALLLVESWTKHVSSSENWSWAQPSELQTWARRLVLRLKLHSAQKSMDGTIMGAKTLDQYPSLRAAIIAKSSLAAYVALMLTDLGENVPLFCEEGLDLLTLLVNGGWVPEALHALHTIMPMFLSCPEVLGSEPKFIECVKQMLEADASYMKIAKNFIASELPGKMLQMMGAMLENLLLHYSYYGLPNSTPWIQLWLPVLLKIPKWEKDRNVFYVLDVLARASLGCTESRQAMLTILKDHLESLPVPKSGRWASVMNWGGTSLQPWPSPSLLWSHFPYLAWTVLEMEYRLQISVWKLVAVELSRSGNKSLDQALKVMTSQQKETVGSACVISYANWICQCPVELPLLPLLWQRFFSFYMYRTDPEHRALGPRLIDKALSTKLVAKAKNLVSKFPDQQLFQVFQVWLEDTRLVEPNLYIPALSAKYAPELLLNIDSQQLWWQHVNWSAVHEERCQLCNVWPKEKFPASSQPPRVVSPSEKILLRLQGYPHPLALSSYPKACPILRPVSYNLLTNVKHLEGFLEPQLSPIISVSMDFCEAVNGLTALDCGYLELLPEEWICVQTSIVKKVACSSGNAPDKNKSVFPCLGLAVIPLQFACEKRQDGVSQRITQNRDEHKNVIRKMLQPPCDRYVIAAMVLQCIVRELERRRSEQGIQQAGSLLFYRLIGTVTEETYFYPPSKQLLSSALETLGHTFIAGHPKECAELLSLMQANPQLAGVLAPHFSPQASVDGFGETAAFVEAYRLVTSMGRAQIDLQFVLLTKFDVASWLHSKFCSSSDRVKLLHYVIEAISGLGLDPDPDFHALHELYRRHLRSLLLFSFPEQYFTVLSHLLKASSSQSLCPIVWYDFLNATGHGLKLTEDTKWEQVHGQLVRAAPEAASHDVKLWLETLHVLSGHFCSERSLYGLYGLYPKYRPYVQALAAILAWTCHAFVCTAVAQDRGTNSNLLLEKLWLNVRDLFSPWIMPYSQQEVNTSCAAWIQQLSNDRRILLPWIQSDANVATTILKAFEASAAFLHSILPANRNVLTHVWSLYTQAFCFTAVKSHVLAPVHTALLNLPWSDFYPSLGDLESMSRVCSQYLPDQHGFIAHILPRVPWANVLQSLTHHGPSLDRKYLSKFLGALLQSVVRMSAEPTARQGDAFWRLLVEATTFPWAFLQVDGCEEVWQWCILSLEPRTALWGCLKSKVSHKGLEDVHRVDMAVYGLLKAASGFAVHSVGHHTDGLQKGRLYIKGWVRLFQTCFSRHKSLMTKPDVIQESVMSALQEYDELGSANSHFVEACFKELIQLLKSGNGLGEACTKAFQAWIQSRKPSHVVDYIRILHRLEWPPALMGNVANIMESLLEGYFKSSQEHAQPKWSVMDTCITYVNSSLLQAAVNQSLLLTFVALLREKTRNAQGCQEHLDLAALIVNACKTMKTKDCGEPKLVLVWTLLLTILSKTGSWDIEMLQEGQISQIVKSASECLSTLRDESQGWKFLGLLARNSFLSDKGKLMTIIIGYLLEWVTRSDNLETKQAISEKFEALKSCKPYMEHSAYVDSIICTLRNESVPGTLSVLSRILAALYSENYMVIVL